MAISIARMPKNPDSVAISRSRASELRIVASTVEKRNRIDG